jgi:ubiquinone/menaquinone biosynthesis C-methylase UbiE
LFDNIAALRETMLETTRQRTTTIAAELRALLTSLYEREIDGAKQNDYIRYHSSEQAIAARVNSFMAYREYLPATGRVLDWGCQHAPDACMVRAIAPALSITGCDFLPDNRYPTFWKYCDLEFVKLDHHVDLPFENDTFDCAIGGGVLEHTAMDYESLKELHRVLKPGGTLIITHLPNKFSYAEFIARTILKRNFHHRLYTLSGFRSLLKMSGFIPLASRRHRLLPTNEAKPITKLLSSQEALLEQIWPLNILSGDILAIAKKITSM